MPYQAGLPAHIVLRVDDEFGSAVSSANCMFEFVFLLRNHMLNIYFFGHDMIYGHIDDSV